MNKPLTPRIFTNDHLVLGQLTLTKEQSQHLHVLRLKKGEHCALFNNTGKEYHARILNDDKRKYQIDIEHEFEISRECKTNIHLAQAIIKSDKMDYAIQKAVEMGVAEITPILSEFTDIKQKAELLAKRHEHWQKVIIAACEQCGRNILPRLNATIKINDWLKNCNTTTLVLDTHKCQKINELKLDKQNINLLIGPEGGFSDAEVDAFSCKPLHTVSLGSRILRAETATVAALSAIQLICDDLT